MAVVARATVRVAGFREMIYQGVVYEDNDPRVRANPSLFETPEEHARRKSRPSSVPFRRRRTEPVEPVEEEAADEEPDRERRQPPESGGTETARRQPGGKRTRPKDE